MELRANERIEKLWVALRWGAICAALAYFGWLLLSKAVPDARRKIGMWRFQRDALAREAKINRDWAETFGEPRDFFTRHPSIEFNDDARSLDATLVKLGVGAISPPETDEPREFAEALEKISMDRDEYLEKEREADRHRVQVTPEERLREHNRIEADKAFSKLVTDYLGSQLGDVEQEVGPIPDELSGFLRDHRANLDAATQTLLHGTPRWRLHREWGMNAEIINLGALMKLGRLFSAAALADLRAGDESRAMLKLRAIRSLSDRLVERCQLTTTQVAISNDRLAAGVFRKFRAWPPGVTHLFSDHGDRSLALREALAGEVYGWELLLGAVAVPVSPSSSAPLKSRSREATITKAWQLDNRRMVTLLYRLNADADPCAAAMPGYRPSAEPEISPYSLYTMMVVPNIKNLIWRVNRLRFDTEGAGKVETLLIARREKLFPPEVPGIGISACNGVKWLYLPSQDGIRVVLKTDPALSWPASLKGGRIPSEIRLHAPNGR